MARTYMTDNEILEIEERMITALSGDHCVAVDALVRGLVRTLTELKQRRANDVKPLRLAQSA